jgi:low affinity Fe/Cu permease
MGSRRKTGRIGRAIEHMSERVTERTGTTGAFAAAVGIILLWAATGPIFHYSDTWQLVINTGTTIITFLMVFLIQRTQNKDAMAIHLKLNEIVAALEGASNRLIESESLPESELNTLRRHYRELAELARHDADVTESHSVEEARQRHSSKRRVSHRRAG